MRGALRWRDAGWSLCIGAGTTIGMLPSWRELARRILQRALDQHISEQHFAYLLETTGWHFDAWIQTALNTWKANGLSHSEFSSEVEKIVYGDLRLAAAAENLEVDLLYAFYDVKLLKRPRRDALIAFFEAQYPRSSSLLLSRFLAKAVRTDRGPEAILTFNYDTVL